MKKTRTATRLLTLITLITISTLLLVGCQSGSSERVFTDGHQSVTLSADGSFSAVLAHSTQSGTYTEATNGGVTTVTFVSGNISVEGSIANKVLTLPTEWVDGHGHGSALPLK